MQGKETIQSVLVNRGENLILNCTCFNECNGQWSGPNTLLVPNAGTFIPYTQGMDLNQRLHKSKYSIFGGYDTHKCNLQVTNFLSDDDGTYTCEYVHSSTVYTDVYNIFATRTKSFAGMSTENQVVENTEPEIDTLKTEDVSCNSKTSDYSVSKLIGSLIGGGLILSICFNIYILLKRKRIVGMVPEILLEGQYDEIGSTVKNSASNQVPSINAQETVTNVDRPASQRTNSDIASFAKWSSTDSSVESLSNTLLNEDGYEHPYQMIDPEHFEAHLYSTRRSNMYQTQSFFQKKI
ncbi:DCC [Mytilus coruscus]|uniref:DCC n=1 Tax=Mytilus coruscus TaxID=42192 RepID=A0A6J8BH59_MYTCO|nr:DCC [Mytilus coruscus]